jgi:hypothetical protein
MTTTPTLTSCPECGGPAHLPEECPRAEWFSSAPTGGACEHWYLTHDRDGQVLSVELSLGLISLEEYYQRLADGVQIMHSVGDCGA